MASILFLTGPTNLAVMMRIAELHFDSTLVQSPGVISIAEFAV